ncbi:MAG: phosphate regulon sensor histidine kinase PhoR [Woeseiaceae bacterium]
MTVAGRKFVLGILTVLLVGGLIGWFYGEFVLGLLVAALLILAVQIRNLIRFERALHDSELDAIGYGEGIWQQIFSRYKYESDRGDDYKKQHRRLIKEIQKSANALPDGAVVIDGQNEIVTCNKAAKRLVGLKRKKDRGQRLDNILRDPALTKLLLEDDATRTADILSPLNENEWLNCRVVPYGAAQKLVLIRDVTERIVLNKIRRDFVANASHELRSPLTVISGYLESFGEDESLPDDLRQPLTQMQGQARRMTAILSDLLELSQLEGDSKAAMDLEVDLGVLMATTQEAFASGINVPTIVTNVESTTKLLGSESEMDSVLHNLVSNAVRHTPAGGQIEITWRSDEAGGDLIVRDNGEGIAEEHIARLTERFFRVDRGRARGEGGFGLGLAIVKHAVERHDGELFINSEPGNGSEFRCHFPLSRLSVT